MVAETCEHLSDVFKSVVAEIRYSVMINELYMLHLKIREMGIFILIYSSLMGVGNV